ncbi:hypothetical protein XENOCAPTIV_003377 [Xenoophorus captivus]|uniref:Secreted protein n=1 Tax=Xenoophorus captivus TaxID=1517983 RepID=A0ABV0RF99_9TELE
MHSAPMLQHWLLQLLFKAGCSQHTKYHTFSFTGERKVFCTAQPQQHLSLISRALTLTYTADFTLNVTASAERSIDAKGSEAPGSILHHFSQLGHIYPPQVIIHL